MPVVCNLTRVYDVPGKVRSAPNQLFEKKAPTSNVVLGLRNVDTNNCPTTKGPILVPEGAGHWYKDKGSIT